MQAHHHNQCLQTIISLKAAVSPNYFLLVCSDPRAKDLVIVRSREEMAIANMAYITMVTILPMIMTRFKALDLKPILLIYNLGLSILSAYMVFEVSFQETFLNTGLTFMNLCT